MSDNYITKEEILSFVEEMEKRTHGDDLITKTVLATTKCVKDFVMHMPPEDVRPVVHGEWIPVTAIYKVKEDQFPQTERVWVDATEPDEIDAVKCSVCGEVFDFADARNWCTQCGAKMDKRKGADE